jgi:hypothetical protein
MDVLGANRFRSSAAPTSSRALLGPAVGIEPNSAKGFLAALPLNYTGPRTLCDSLASSNQNLSRASEFRDHCWMFRLRRTREPLFSSFDQTAVPSSLRTSAWRTLRRQARAMRRNGLHIARLSRGIRVCNRRAMGRQPRRASQG